MGILPLVVLLARSSADSAVFLAWDQEEREGGGWGVRLLLRLWWELDGRTSFPEGEQV